MSGSQLNIDVTACSFELFVHHLYCLRNGGLHPSIRSNSGSVVASEDLAKQEASLLPIDSL